MTLFSYCIPCDDGAAPNPFWDICTLAICKPVIRRTAEVGDWVVATGSKKYGFENKVVYAMKISQILTFEEYDKLCKSDKYLKNKIPDWSSSDLRKKFGDCLYDYAHMPMRQRKGVHNGDNKPRDLRGKNVLLSDHFYYFGSSPIDLPNNLFPIVQHGQGHKSKANLAYVDEFLQWIDTNGQYKNIVNSLPWGFDDLEYTNCITTCSQRHAHEDDEDEKLENI